MGRRLEPGRLWQLLGLLLLATVAAGPLLFQAGFLNTRGGGDSPFLLFRLQQLVTALADGQFPARWMPDAAYGYGYPFFSYYASLPYYVAALFHFFGLGLIASVKLVQWLGFLLAAWASWGLARAWRPNPSAAAWLVSAAYTFAPYHLVNVYVRGDSLVEFWAMGLFPLLVRLALRLWQQPDRGRFVQFALAYAALVCTHNVSALLFSPFLLLLALFLCWRYGRWRLLTSLGLGLALSAFFWLPALGEQDAVQLVAQTSGYFHFSNHFRSLGGDAAPLVQSALIFDYDVAGQTPFSMGLVQALLVVLGLVATGRALWRRRFTEGRGALELFALLAWLVATLMVTPLSQFLWQHLPLLPMVQFPWRFLSVQALTGALLLVWLLPAGRPRAGWLLAAAGILLSASVMLGLHPDALALTTADVTPENLQLYEWFSGNVGTTIRYEYLPKAAVPRPWTSDVLLGDSPAARSLDGDATTTLLSKRTGREQWRVEVSSESATLTFPTYYWPGWRATVDGRPTPVYPAAGLGTLALDLPAGAHQVTLHLGRTPLRLIAEWLSLLSLLAGLGWWGWGRWRDWWRRYRQGGLVALVVLAAISLVLHAIPPRVLPAGDLTWDFDQQAFLHHSPAGVSFGDQAVMAEYETSVEDGRLVVEVQWESIRESGLMAEVAWVHPAATQQGVPLVLAAGRQAVDGDVTRWTIELPETTPPGPLLPRLRLWDAAGQSLAALTVSGQPRGDLYLYPVWPVEPEPADLPAGELTLLQITSRPLDAEHLAISLQWGVGVSLPANYKLALRLRDADGTQWAQLDAQPGYGFYPTSSWQAGTRFWDTLLLDVPAGLPPGDYTLSVLLYDAVSLEPFWGPEERPLTLTAATPYDGRPLLHHFGDRLAVAGLDSSAAVSQGDPLDVTVTWVSLQAWDSSLLLNWELRGGEGQTAAAGAITRTVDWPADSLILGRYRLDIEPQTPAGDYQLFLSLRDPLSGETLGEAWPAATVRVKPAERLMEVPPMQTAVSVEFGNVIRLAGYDLEQTADRLDVTLYWQALDRPPADYVVFVHLFDPLTEQIPVQSDSMPRGDQYPTSRWAAGEVVVDTISLTLANLPAGEYRLGVGLYQVEGNQYPRLPAVVDLQEAAPDGRYVLPARIVLPAN